MPHGPDPIVSCRRKHDVLRRRLESTMYTQTDEPAGASHAYATWDTDCAADVLIEVDFKWLMAGQGRWIDPVRLRADPLYAQHCLETASHSPCDALRRCAHHLQVALGNP